MSKAVTDYVKRIQSWVTRQLKAKELDIKCSMQDVRDFYCNPSFVVNPEQPTVEEYDRVRNVVLDQLISKTEEGQMVSDLTEDIFPIEKVDTSSGADLTEAIDQDDDQIDDHKIVSVNHIEEMMQEELNSALSITDTQNNELSLPDQEYSLNVQEEVEKYFPQEKAEVHEAIINYVEEKAFRNAEELKTALNEISDAQLAVFLKIADDHNKQQELNHQLFKQRLVSVQEIEEKKIFQLMRQRTTRLESFKRSYGVVQQ